MRLGPLAAAFFALCAAAGDFDDSGVVLTYAPQALWRAPNGDFTGKREGDKVVLVYDYLSEGEGYSACPARGAKCAEAQRAVAEAFDLWSGASGRLVVRRRAGSEPVNFWISWTTKLRATVVGGSGPRGLSVDNSRSAEAPAGPVVENFGGLARPMRPGVRKEFGSLFFNDNFCWVVDDASVCPPPVNTGFKIITSARPVRETSLHEGGHVLGFGHFTAPSIMGRAGGTGRYELTALDREAIRRVYDQVGR